MDVGEDSRKRRGSVAMGQYLLPMQK
jgi:hypothetical protein